VPERDHLGIEIRRRYAWRIAHEMGLAGGPRNCRVVWGDAKLVAPGLFGDGSVADIYINFPDPWWKAKHVKRRLVDDDFSTLLARLLVPGGQCLGEVGRARHRRRDRAGLGRTDGRSKAPSRSPKRTCR
jgi:tRNA G46 methylase TrmB